MISNPPPILGALGLLSCSFVLAKTGRDTMFFSAGGIDDLPLTYAAMAVLSMPMAAATLALIRRAGRRRACQVGIAGTALGLLMLSATLAPNRSVWLTIAFVAIPLAFGVLFSMAWLLVADTAIGRGRSQSHGFAWAGTAALLGGLAGGAIARWLAPAVSAPGLLATAAGVLSMSAVLVGRVPRSSAVTRPLPLPAGAPTVVQTGPVAVPLPPRAALLVAFGALTGVVGVLVEFQFYAAVSGGAHGGAAADQFANLYLGMNAGALLALHATPLLQRFTGLGGTLMLLPASVSVLSSALWMGVGGGRTVLRLAEGSLKASTHRIGWEQVFVRIPAAQRTRLKLTVDGMATRLAEGATGLALFLIGGTGSTSTIATAALALAGGAWVVVTARIWGGYVEEGPGDGSRGRMPDS